MKAPFAAKAALAALLALSASEATAQDAVAEADMERYCIGEAAGKFGTRPDYIKMRKLRTNRNGSHSAVGTFDSTAGPVGFECRYGPQGRFNWIRTKEERREAAAARAAEGPTPAQIDACGARAGGGGEVVETSALKPGHWEVILDYPDGEYVCEVAPGGEITHFAKLH